MSDQKSGDRAEALVDWDCTQRFTFQGTDIRGEVVKLDASYKELLSNHYYPPGVASLLGEFLAAVVLMSTGIKFDGRMVLQARSEGEISLIMAECSSEQAVRGIVRMPEQAMSSDFHALLRGATLAITVEPDQGERYQSLVPLTGDNLAECLAFYFRQSEQLNSVFFLFVGGERVAGMLLQQLPPQSVTDPQDRQLQWEHVVQLAATLSAEELFELSNTQILYRLYHEDDLRLYERVAVSHHCSCSMERTARMLMSLGREELEDILKDQGEISVNCEFCNQHYHFDQQTVEALLAEQPPSH